MLWTGAIKTVAVFVDCYLRYDGQFRIYFARSKDCLMQFLQIHECLEDKQIYSLIIQSGDLLAERFPGFFQSYLAQRLNADSQRPDGARNQRVETLRCFPSQLGSAAVDFHQPIHKSVLRQAKRIRAECVCFNDFGARLEVFQVYALDQFGFREVEFVVTLVDVIALGQQKRAHGSITKYRPLLQSS